MSVLSPVALVLACLGAGWAILGTPGWTGRSRVDAVGGLTGLAALTGLGGWIVLAGAYSETAGWGLLAIGGGMLIHSVVRARGRTVNQGAVTDRELQQVSPGARLLSLLCFVLIIGRAWGELVIPFSEPWDDWPSYWHFPRLLLESGGFVEPFSLRRLSALGATQFAQAFFWPGFRIAANGMTDAVLGQLLLWAVVRAIPNALSNRPQPAWIGEALALGALLVSLTIPNLNSQPALLPMAGALVLILLTQRLTTSDATASDSTASRFRSAIAWGLVAAWLIGLRTSNVAFPGGLWLVSALVAIRHQDRRQALHLAMAGMATLVGLLPWCLALWQSSGTPLYPLIAGNYRFPEGLYSVPLDGSSLFALVGDRLWVSRVWIVAALGALAALRPGVRLPAIQVITALVLLVAVSAAGTTGLDAITVHRLSAPFLAAGVIFFTGAVMVRDVATPAEGQVVPRWDIKPLVLWAGLALWFVMPIPIPANAWPVPVSNRSMFTWQGVQRLNAAAGAWQLGGKVEEFHREEYEAAQALLPDAARLVSATLRPYLFRFDRQTIHTLDFPFPGVVSPAPGMPVFSGPERLAQYFRDRGYTHLAFSPALFAITREQFGQDDGTRYSPWLHFHKLRPYFHDFMENVERLERSYLVVYRANELTLIDLHQPQQADTTGKSAW